VSGARAPATRKILSASPTHEDSWRDPYNWVHEIDRRQVLSNPHSPSHWRVVGPTRNVDAWYETFDVKPGDKYYLPPDKRVHLW